MSAEVDIVSAQTHGTFGTEQQKISRSEEFHFDGSLSHMQDEIGPIGKFRKGGNT